MKHQFNVSPSAVWPVKCDELSSCFILPPTMNVFKLIIVYLVLEIWAYSLITFPNRPGRLLRLFLEPKSLTREKTFSRLGFSQLPLVLLGLLTQRQAFDFSRSLACLFCRMRELAIAAAMASLAAFWRKLPEKRDDHPLRIQKTGFCRVVSRRRSDKLRRLPRFLK